MDLAPTTRSTNGTDPREIPFVRSAAHPVTTTFVRAVSSSIASVVRFRKTPDPRHAAGPYRCSPEIWMPRPDPAFPRGPLLSNGAPSRWNPRHSSGTHRCAHKLHNLTIILYRMHEIPIEDSIDLHTFQPREIQIVVEEYCTRPSGAASTRFASSTDVGSACSAKSYTLR